MRSCAALLALLALLSVPDLALADDHSAGEVQERFGVPQAREVVSCGGEQEGQAVRCLRWQYDSGTDHAVFFFDVGTERLVEVFTWNDGSRDATVATDEVRSLLHAARNVSGP